MVALLVGGLSALGFAPLDWWPLTILALTWLVNRVRRARGLRAAFLIGLVFGTGHFIVGLNWIATAFTFQSNMPAWYGWGAVVVLATYLALFPALSCALTWWLTARQPWAFAFIFAAVWMAGEWLRATLLSGFAWDPVGMVWLPLSWVAQAGQWIGVYGLSGLAVLAAALLGAALQWRWRSAVGLTVLLGALIMALGYRMSARQGARDDSTLRARIVQPNISQDTKYDPALSEQHDRIYASLSGPPEDAPRILLWPEGATLHYLELEPDAVANLTKLLGPHDILLTGGASATPINHDYTYRNSVFAIDHQGGFLWRYDKAHLVPFGEFLPLRSFFEHLHISRLVPGERDFTPGTGPATYPLPGFTINGKPALVGVQICYEIIFSGHVIDRAHRPSFLFNPSNDAWFGAWGPAQHLAQARMRAIEEGVAVLRATPTGISAVVGPRGELRVSAARQSERVLETLIPDALPPTMFSRYGLWASLAVGIGLLAVGCLLRVALQRGEVNRT
jgi:apolipoprotein N-acyltransferase